MAHFLILGAGAVGSALGAYLSRAGHAATLVARPEHVRAIERRGGLLVRAYDEEFTAAVRAVAHPPASVPEDTVVFVTVQSPDVRAALESARSAAASFPVVTWQNGIRAEEDAAPFAPRLYGGVVRFTCTLLDPGEVRLRAPGQLILGRHPEGTDPFCKALRDMLAGAGFRAAVSPRIGSDKALKLLVNLVSGPAVLYRRSAVDFALARVQVALLEEARAVYAAAGMNADPASGLGEPVDVLIERFRAGGTAPDGREVYNSTWQNLHHRRGRLENRYYHGEIAALGLRHGIPTPVNERALAVLEDVRARGLGPEPFTRGEFMARFADLVDFTGVDDLPPPGRPAGALEI